jgi:hypothetical protein
MGPRQIERDLVSIFLSAPNKTLDSVSGAHAKAEDELHENDRQRRQVRP